MRPDLQVWAYPEESQLAGPRGLARLVADLGFGAVSVAVTYHQCMRVFPRYASAQPGAGGLQFDPTIARYDYLTPALAARAVGSDPLLALRRACDTEGLAFRAWVVVLDNEPLTAAHPTFAAQTLDGAPTMHALCPSHTEVRDYAAALVADITDQFSPDLIDLEAALYPRWNSYVAEIALNELTPIAKRYGAQCLCTACSRLLAESGVNPNTMRELLRSSAGPPFGAVAVSCDDEIIERLSAVRDIGIEQLIARLRSQISAETKLRLLGFGTPLDARLQGLGPRAAAAADEVLLGFGQLSGAALAHQLDAHLAIHDPAATAVGLNWGPERDGESLGEDALSVLRRGVPGLALYNLSLVPEVGLADLRMAVAMARATT